MHQSSARTQLQVLRDYFLLHKIISQIGLSGVKVDLRAQRLDLCPDVTEPQCCLRFVWANLIWYKCLLRVWGPGPQTGCQHYWWPAVIRDWLCIGNTGEGPDITTFHRNNWRYIELKWVLKPKTLSKRASWDMKISLINDPKICVAKWFQIGPKRLMLAIICVWQYLCSDWGLDPRPAYAALNFQHSLQQQWALSQERGGLIMQRRITEPLNQRGNKEVWTLKGFFDFVNIRVVIMFHEC